MLVHLSRVPRRNIARPALDPAPDPEPDVPVRHASSTNERGRPWKMALRVETGDPSMLVHDRRVPRRNIARHAPGVTGFSG
jgi:hypothetical protein